MSVEGLTDAGLSRRLLGITYRRIPGLLWVGLIGSVVVIVLTLFGTAISGFSPSAQNLGNRLLPPLTDGHILGTDQLGRDVFSRVAAGFEWSIPVALLSTTIAATLGTLVGVAAGWNEGWMRAGLVRFMDVAISFPTLVLAVAVITVTGHTFWSLTLILGFISWVAFARVIYAETRQIKDREYVLAARLMAIPRWRIIATYVLRGLRHTIVVMSAFVFADLLVAEAALSFLGVGAPLGEPSWGNMLSASRVHVFTAPWLMYGPAGAVILAVITANALGDGFIQIWGKGTTQQ